MGGFRPSGAERCWGHPAWSTVIRRLFQTQAQGLSSSQQGAGHQASLMQRAAEPGMHRDPERPLKTVSRIGMPSRAEIQQVGASLAEVRTACSGRWLAAGTDT